VMPLNRAQAQVVLDRKNANVSGQREHDTEEDDFSRAPWTEFH